MPNILTTDSTVHCGHNGSVAIEGVGKLCVNGNKVLSKTGIMGKSIASSECQNPILPTTNNKCSNVSSVILGEATKLTTGREPVMLDTLQGTTDGLPVGNLGSSAEQTKLTAI